MKKKLFAAVLTAAMVLGLVACGSSTGTSSTTTSDEPYKIGMVTDTGGVNDGSFNQSSWEGLSQLGEDYEGLIEVNYLESATDSDYSANIETFVDEEYDLIIGVGYMLADAIGEAADANPDILFAIIDDSTNADKENVACLMFEQSQASYLVGYVAGLMTESNVVGFVLGMSTTTMNEFGYGYVAGVLDANPDATVLQSNANSFGDSATGKSLANAQITNGADVIFHAAGGTGLGVIEACKEANIYAIGVDSDQSSYAPENVITSAMKRVDTASYEIGLDAYEGNFTAGIHTYDLASEGVDIAPTTDLLPDDVISTIEEIKEQIIAGDIVVPKTQEEFEAAYGDVYTLD
ncbi:MAG: BMP family ABC transporter substrate-binding protein [Lachnospiraceae bacterium]|nr:BMP family ABC transporter substrate-binding protein [Lachnospiraceae bacterium]